MTPEAWQIVIGALVTIQLTVNGFLCITQISQGVRIATLTAKLDVLMGDRERKLIRGDDSGSWEVGR